MTELYPYASIPENLPWPDRVCCAEMRRYRTLNSDCVQHGYNCPDRPISWFDGDYLIRSPNGEYRITYCPWCGSLLNNNVKYPKRITRQDFDQLLCHDCAQPLKETMCTVCCECRICNPNECEPKYRWMIEESGGCFVIYGSTSVFAPRHTDPPKPKTVWTRMWNACLEWLFGP